MFRQNKQRSSKSPRRENHVFRDKSKSKSKNKRTEPAARHCVEYNPETTESLRKRWRMRRKREFKIAVTMIGFIGLLALGRVVVKEAFMDNPDFHLQNVSVITSGSLSPERIVKEAKVVRGQNLLMISLSTVRERLERLPEVQKASVERQYPGLLILKVEQRQPVARLQFAQELRSALTQIAGYGCLVDAEGVVLSEANFAGSIAKLPVIVMDQSMLPMPGQSLTPVPDTLLQGAANRPAQRAQVEVQQVLAALHLLQLHRNSALASQLELTRIDASGSYALRAEYGVGGPVITYASRDLEKQERRFEAMVRNAEKQHRELATMNLLVERNVPVTFRQTGTASAEPALLERRGAGARRGLATAD